MSLFTDDGYFYDVSAGKKYFGPEIGLTVDIYAAAFPDMHRELYALRSFGDHVLVELSLNGTHKGDLVLDFNSPWLRAGFNNPEPDAGYRWTTGRAPLPNNFYRLFDGSFEVPLDVVCTAKYPSQLVAGGQGGLVDTEAIISAPNDVRCTSGDGRWPDWLGTGPLKKL